MAKNVYNFEIFTNKKDQLKKIHKKQQQKEWARRILIIVLILFVAFIAYMPSNSRCEYYIYKEETETENNANVKYETFANGYIKYGQNGIEYQRNFGVADWNIPVSFQNPFLVKAEPYILLADKGGNTLMLFNASGKVRDFTVRYPVVQASVSEQGTIEVILQGEGSNFIQMYDIEGNLVADMRSSVDETGYPLTAAISPDGTRLVVSYLAIDGMSSRTTVAFYDFSQQLRTDGVSLLGGFEYEDSLIARLHFVDDNTLVAFGDTATYYYNVSHEPEVKKEVAFEEEIQSIFIGDDYIGYVLDNSENPEEGRYRLCLYNKSGSKKLDTDVDMEYENIEMRGKEIIAVQDNMCTIMNAGGKILFQEELDGNGIEAVLPVRGWRTYQVVFRNKIVEMKLRFWSKGAENEDSEEENTESLNIKNQNTGNENAENVQGESQS